MSKSEALWVESAALCVNSEALWVKSEALCVNREALWVKRKALWVKGEALWVKNMRHCGKKCSIMYKTEVLWVTRI